MQTPCTYNHIICNAMREGREGEQDRWMDGQMDRQEEERDRWMDGVGQMDGQMGRGAGQMDGRTDGQTGRRVG